MLLLESEDELGQLHTDSDSESECSHGSLDEDYVPRGAHARGPDPKDFTEEDSSDEERDRKPANRRVSPRKRLGSLSAPSPLKSPPKKSKRSPVAKKNRFAPSPQKKDASSRNRGKTSAPRGKNQSRKSPVSAAGGEDDGDRWRNADEEDVEPPQPRFRPARDVGPQLNRTANYTPLELFQLFFSCPVVDTLVRNTNVYGKRKHQGQKERWVPVTTADMHSVICLNFRFPASAFKAPPFKVPAAPSDGPAALTPPTEVPPAPDAPRAGHLPAYFVEQMTNVASRYRATAGRRACVVCKRKSPVYCSTCRKTLCFTTLRNCYSEWHRLNHICV
ncbi:hypothetical protein EYF80_049932 [Liparis tanakae]|uniref:PiggyBac transposable element-derived protein domain-containing protein n=1 Tax=Liparis tanakae TaxID=230148 RepID=A0A4Z2FGM1_9TELE|nr:hypothetical protein EYF80_049932 [Liparis tanakae]